MATKPMGGGAKGLSGRATKAFRLLLRLPLGEIYMSYIHMLVRVIERLHGHLGLF